MVLPELWSGMGKSLAASHEESILSAASRHDKPHLA